MKKALVTGGQGFIGGHLVDRLIDEKYDDPIFSGFEKLISSNDTSLYLYILLLIFINK